MSTAVKARSILQETFPLHGGRNVTTALSEAYEALKRLERSLSREALEERGKRWTERRVKALWKGEARRIDYHEITDLEAVRAVQAKAEYRRLIADLRRVQAFVPADYQAEVGRSEAL